jgi:hypothetical protein
MSHSTGSVAAQSIGFKYVMVPEPYTGTPGIYQNRFAILFKITVITES